jgi:prepilin-type N-terminal cleavage/methylation domain-containing protein
MREFNKSGFTLIEVMAATAMLGIALVFLLSSLGSAAFTNSQLIKRSQAIRGMYNYADLYRMQPNASAAAYGSYAFVDPTNRHILSTIAPLPTKVESAGPIATNTTLGYVVHKLDFSYTDVDGLLKTNSIKVLVRP